MAFFEKLKRITSGKTELERKQEKAALSEIRKSVMAAQLRERRTQAVKFAVEKERLKYSKATKKLKNPKPYFGGFNVVAPEYKNYGSITGQPRMFKGKKFDRKSKRRGIDILGI